MRSSLSIIRISGSRAISPKNFVAIAGFAFFLYPLVASLRHLDAFVSFLNTQDFCAYWYAARAYFAKANIYDPHVLARYHSEYCYVPLTVRFPPWTLLIFAPILSLSVLRSVAIWSSLQLVVLCSAAFVLFATSSRERGRYHAYVEVLLLLTFLPLLYALRYAQAAFFVVSIILLALYLVRKQYFVIAGGLFALATIKPHLFWVLAPYLLFSQRVNELLRLTFGFVVIFSLMILSVYLKNPSLFSHWIEALAISQEWHSPSLFGFLRSADGIGDDTMLRALLLFGIGIGIAIARAVKLSSDYEYYLTASMLMLFSLLLSPYCWIFDYTVGLLVPIIFYRIGAVWFLSCYVLLTFIAYLQSVYLHIADYRFAWYPLALSLLIASYLLMLRTFPALVSDDNVEA